MKEKHCRNCGEKIDANTAVEDETLLPKVGDLSVCAYCGVISQFNNQMDLEPVAPEDMVKLNETEPDTFDQLMKVARIIRESIRT